MWFRRDLRVADNEALLAASAEGAAVVALFVIDDRLVGGPRMSATRLAYLRAALRNLDAALQDRGSSLLIRRGDPREVVPAAARSAGAEAVCWSADHSPYAARRDAAVRAALRDAGIAAHSFGGVTVHEPGTVLTAAGTPFKVFSPFRRAWWEQPRRPALPAPQRIVATSEQDTDAAPAGMEALLSGLPAAAASSGWPHAGEAAAHQRLTAFLAEDADTYAQRRDRLDAAGTSRLSAALHFGCLSPQQIFDRLEAGNAGHEAFATELVWREFALHVLAAWPQVAHREFDPAYRALPWHRDSAHVEAWRRGETGVPIVDAGMRQLLAEGWMHNRARMIVASFLCKHLLVDWRLGEAHFLRHLVDGDWASNNLGWQWAAGTGTDAQPYFRMFNPARQGARHDPDGTFVRRYVPELTAVPDRWIHAPWTMPDEEQRTCGVRIGGDYPAPLVDHDTARAEAQAWFARHRRPR